jgi:hypothetical protein
LVLKKETEREGDGRKRKASSFTDTTWAGASRRNSTWRRRSRVDGARNKSGV